MVGVSKNSKRFHDTRVLRPSKKRRHVREPCPMIPPRLVHANVQSGRRYSREGERWKGQARACV